MKLRQAEMRLLKDIAGNGCKLYEYQCENCPLRFFDNDKEGCKDIAIDFLGILENEDDGII